MPKKISITTQLWMIYAILVVVSILAITSSSVELDIYHGSSLYALLKHFIIIIVSLSLIISMMSGGEKTINFFYNITEPGLLGVIAITFLTALLGPSANESRRALSIHGLPSINTFEIAKGAVVLYLAKILSKDYPDEQTREKELWNKLIPVGIILIPIGLNNLSTVVIIVVISYILLWLAHIPKEMMNKINKVLLGLFIIGLLVIIINPSFIRRSTTWANRIHKFVTNTYTPSDQAFQAKVAISSTSIFHFKPGQGNSKYYIPLSYTDYIFAIIAEEEAIVAFLLPLIYLWLLFLSGKIAFHQQKPYHTLLILGFGLLISLQALIHIAVNLGIAPETGQTLPLISLGGTSFFLNSAMFGFILTIHKISLKNKYQPQQSSPNDKVEFHTQEFDNFTEENNEPNDIDILTL